METFEVLLMTGLISFWDVFIPVTTSACPVFLYGVNCSEPCGNCKNNATCDVTTGFCIDGCLDGWTGNRCANQVTKEYPVAISVLSTLLGVFGLLLLLIGIQMYLNFRRDRKDSIDLSSHEIGDKAATPKTGQVDGRYDTLKTDEVAEGKEVYLGSKEPGKSPQQSKTRQEHESEGVKYLEKEAYDYVIPQNTPQHSRYRQERPVPKVEDNAYTELI